MTKTNSNLFTIVILFSIVLLLLLILGTSQIVHILICMIELILIIVFIKAICENL